ncbi:MAG: type 4a pilus biogenesis protein PilO [Anaerohalosphaeraceae bacterium]|nr:type 4a pilus biogenesis protein PilO [Anaerohalosphaeraceae bacterium]
MKIAEKKQFCIAAAIVVIAGVFLLLQYLPTVKKAKAYEVANLRLITANAEAAAKMQELPHIYECIARAEEHSENYDLKVPQARSHGIFLQTIAGMMQEQGLTELVIRPGSETEAGVLGCIPVTISCNGKTEQIFDFFKSMEKFERIVKVEYVSFKNSDKYDGLLAMRMEAKIFYRKK